MESLSFKIISTQCRLFFCGFQYWSPDSDILEMKNFGASSEVFWHGE